MVRYSYRSRSARLISALGLLALALFGLLGATAAQAQTSSGTMLSGYVFNFKGEFVSGATIHLYQEPKHTDTGITAVSDAGGRWSLDTGTGTFAVSAAAVGYNTSEQTVYATSYQTGITFILRDLGAQANLPLVATISGNVTSLDGVPLGGVNIVANDQRDTGVRQTAPPPVLNATMTDAAGNYSLQVPAGTIWLTLKAGAAWGYQLNPINVTAGQNLTGTDFKAAIRVLPRTDFPTATAVPLPTATPVPQSNVSPAVGSIGMPRTGHNDLTGWGLLIAASLLLLLGGSALTRTARKQQ